jgi:hypothetical protein
LASGVRVIVAVYVVEGEKVVGEPDHETVPVYPFAAVTAVTGVAPTTGRVTPPIAATEIGVFGVAETEAEIAPVPRVLIARNRIEYVVPFVNPGIVTGEVASAGESAAKVPPSIEYS